MPKMSHDNVEPCCDIDDLENTNICNHEADEAALAADIKAIEDHLRPFLMRAVISAREKGLDIGLMAMKLLEEGANGMTSNGLECLITQCAASPSPSFLEIDEK